MTVRKLNDEGQIDLAREYIIDMFDELKNRVSVPNMIMAMQMQTADLAYDTAPSNTVATSMLLEVINMKLRMEMEEERGRRVMNIFVLAGNPWDSAKMQCDKHVVKMPLETAQMLCSVWHRYGHGDKVPYKEAHKNTLAHYGQEILNRTTNGYTIMDKSYVQSTQEDMVGHISVKQ